MTVRNAIETINQTTIPEIRRDFYATVENFWERFVVPKLPNRDVVLGWHRLLMEYVEQDGAILALRAGSTAGTLRRGWYTVIPDESYSFFYSDNDFAHYFFRMALNNYYPTLAEFMEAMRDRVIPAHFNRYGGDGDDANEGRIAYFNISGRNPGLGLSNDTCGYKLAHVLNSGAGFVLDGVNYGMADICRDFFPLGNVEDWHENNDGDFIRSLPIREDRRERAKSLAKAAFLRFVDPINHFLSPKDGENVFWAGNSGVKTTIAEWPSVVNYVRSRYLDLYGDDYEEYLDAALADDAVAVDADENISLYTGIKSVYPQVTRQVNGTGTRDRTKYVVDGHAYGKGKFVLLVIKEYVHQHPGITYDALLGRFSMRSSFDRQTAVRRMRDVRPVEVAQGRKRVFDDDVFAVNGADDVCVNSQWGVDDMPQFLEIARELRIDFTVQQ